MKYLVHLTEEKEMTTIVQAENEKEAREKVYNAYHESKRYCDYFEKNSDTYEVDIRVDRHPDVLPGGVFFADLDKILDGDEEYM